MSMARIGSALVVGIFIIFISLRVNATGDAQAVPNGALIATAPTREYIESVDTDGDGVKDWEEALQARFVSATSPTSTPDFVLNTEPYTPPTTLTGRFSEAFLEDYLSGKMRGEDFSDPSAFIARAVSAIEESAQSKTHSRIELTLVPATQEAIREYGNTLVDIIKKHSINNENEISILERALNTNNPAILDELQPIEAVYANTIKDALPIEVPDSLVLQHLAFLNVSEAILTDIQAMQTAFDDPLYALARVKGYEENSKKLYNTFASLRKAFDAEGVTFTEGESGLFFYIFEQDNI